MKKKIANLLRLIAERLDPTPQLQRTQDHCFGHVIDVVVDTKPSQQKKTEEVAVLLRNLDLNHIHTRALEIFISEDSSRNEYAYWNLKDWTRRAYLDKAIAELLQEANYNND